MLEGISAITLATHDMRRAVAFYETLGFVRKYGGPEATFTSFNVGTGALNLTRVSTDKQWSWWMWAPRKPLCSLFCARMAAM